MISSNDCTCYERDIAISSKDCASYSKDHPISRLCMKVLKLRKILHCVNPTHKTRTSYKKKNQSSPLNPFKMQGYM